MSNENVWKRQLNIDLKVNIESEGNYMLLVIYNYKEGKYCPVLLKNGERVDKEELLFISWIDASISGLNTIRSWLYK